MFDLPVIKSDPIDFSTQYNGNGTSLYEPSCG